MKCKWAGTVTEAEGPAPARVVTNVKSPGGGSGIIVLTIPGGVIISRPIHHGCVVNIDILVTLGVADIHNVRRFIITIDPHEGDIVDG